MNGAQINYVFRLGETVKEPEKINSRGAGLPSNKLNTIDEACQLFVNEVQKVDVVKEMHLYEGDEGAMLLTVISAEPFQIEPRDSVFKAERKVTRCSSKPLVDFRLLNVRELTNDTRPGAIPTDSKVLWARRHVIPSGD